MSNPISNRFWPFRPRASILLTAVILATSMVGLLFTQNWKDWPSENAENTVLIGIGLISLLPILLAVMDVLIERGGAFEFQGVKIDFSKANVREMTGITVPVNIGFTGQAVTDSSTTEILDTLRDATSCNAAIIDLADGQAWWETRLFVLVAGAARIGKPGKVIFLATDGGAKSQFQGWAHTGELLDSLLRAHPQYERIYHAVKSAEHQWRMVEPSLVDSPPQNREWMSELARRYSWMVADSVSGIPKTHFPEQMLASELGEQIESQNEVKMVTLRQLEELFRPVLHRESLCEDWPPDDQLRWFFKYDDPYLAVTRDGKYIRMVSRMSVMNALMKQVVTPGKAPGKDGK